MTQMKLMEREGRQLVNGYGPEGFRVSGVTYDSTVLVHPKRSIAFDIQTLDALSTDHLTSLVDGDEKTEILLLGCGKSMQFVPDIISKGLALVGVAVDPMDSAAAARTYNMLMMEDRRVAALLFPMI